MSLPVYAELDCLSNYTFLTGASHPEELVAQAATLGYRALALCDECSLAGVVRAWERLQQYPRTENRLRLLVGSRFRFADSPGWTLIVLAQDRSGYGHLARWITQARRRSPKGRYHLILDDLLDPEGAQAGLPGCLMIARPDDSLPVQTCEPALQKLRPLLAGRLWLGLALRQGDHDARHTQALRQLSQRHALPWVALGAVEMHQRSRQPLHDTLCAIRLHRPIAECAEALRPNTEHAMRSRLRLARLYPADALDETWHIAQRCTFTLDMLRYQYPEPDLPAGMDASAHLQAECLKGARERYPAGIPRAVRQQLEEELSLVKELAYEPYFLTVYDLIRHARRRNILCQGRGSAGNSLICYCLGITEVDPLARGLLFARFISRERGEPPDIDVDFEHHRREEIIQHIYQHYGRDRAALTAVVIRYRHRSALRDTGKALGMDPALIDKLSRLIRHRREPQAVHELLKQHCPEERATQWAALLQELIGFPRHLSQHPGGFVIARDPLDTLVPLENAAMPERSLIQWDKDDLDAMGLLKIDVLALGMLTVLHECETWAARRRAHTLSCHHNPLAPGRNTPSGTSASPNWSLSDIPLHDEATFDMISRADTIGVFQIESRAQMSMLPRMRPASFYDLVIQVAIVRPGPMQGGMVHPYLRRRQGQEPVRYPSRETRDILERTLGIPIFQEQAMRLAITAAGFTPSEADQLRRAMAAWRRTGTVSIFHTRLRAGMLARGYDRDDITRLIRQLEGFGEYGFPESHAAAFARLAWLSAWLKCHEPEAYLVAMLNAQPMGFYTPSQLVQDARRHGVRVLPVCVAHSAAGACLEWPAAALDGRRRTAPRPAVRLGLSQIRGLSQNAILSLIEQRGHSPYTSINDVRIRCGLATRDMQALARAHAFSVLQPDRRMGHWESALPQAPGLLHSAPIHESRPPRLPPLSDSAHTLADYAATGLTLGRHPVSFLRAELHTRRFRNARDLHETCPDRRLARACGLVISRQRPHTAGGIIFVTLEDESGTVNVIVPPREAAAQYTVLMESSLMGIYGIWQRQHGICHLMAKRLVDLSTLLEGLKTHSRDFH